MSRQVLLLISMIAAAGAPAFAQSFDVNPYTGDAYSLEGLSRELETARAQTAVLEERVKQAQLSMTLNVVPARQRAELEALEMQAKAASQVNSPPPPPAQPTPPRETRPAPPPEPVIWLSGVIRSGDSLSALIDVDGHPMAVKNGDQTQFGSVTILSEQAVQLGGRELRVNENMIARVALPDAEPGTVGFSSASSQRVSFPPPLPAPGN